MGNMWGKCSIPICSPFSTMFSKAFLSRIIESLYCIGSRPCLCNQKEFWKYPDSNLHHSRELSHKTTGKVKKNYLIIFWEKVDTIGIQQ